MRYDHIQQLAFPIHPNKLVNLLQPYQACTFPRSWKAAIADLLYPDRTTHDRGVPLRDLTTAFATFQPEVIVNGAAADGRLWLGAARKPDNDILEALIHSGITTVAHAWARKYPAKGVQLDRLPDLLAGINPATDLRWETVRPVHTDEQTPGDPTFRLLPDLLAAHIAQEFSVDHGGVATSRFQRIATTGGAELVSWPPHPHPYRKKPWPWSYVIRLTVQTMPADPTPYLFVHIGLRRYASRKVFLTNNDRALSAAIKAPAPWYHGEMPAAFARATLKWRPGPPGKKEGLMDWTDDIVAVLQRYHGGLALPDPTKLSMAPLKHIPDLPDFEPGYEAAVFYRTGYAYKHAVGDGVSPKDRWRIFDQLTDLLHPHLRAVGLARRVPSVTVPARPASKKTGIRIPADRVAGAVGRTITAEVWWQTSTMRDEILAALPRTLQMPDLIPGTMPGTWQTTNDDLTLTVHTRELQDLAQKLHVDRAITRKQDRMRDAASRRIAQIDDWLKPHPATGPTFALVELDDASAFTDESDPKHATRTGAGRNGRNTQFLTPPGTEETEAARTMRIEQSIRDLFVRQAGVPARPARLGLDDQPLPDTTRVVALWLIRKNTPQSSAYPVAVCCDPRQPVIKVRLPGDRTWHPMHEALLRLSTLRGEQALLNSDKVTAFVDDLIDQLGGLDGPTLLISHAQNMRGNWKTTTNARLTLDNLATTVGTYVAASRHPGVRYIRTRTNLSQETAQHYAHAERTVPDGKGGEKTQRMIGISAGLWHPATPHGRTFLSTPDKPPTAAKSAPKGSRIEQRTRKTKDGGEVQVVDIGADVWNPQLVELFVATIQDGDNPAAWAAAAHQYRYIAAHYDDPTLLPLPMHHGLRAGEYLLPGHQLDTKLTGPME